MLSKRQHAFSLKQISFGTCCILLLLLFVFCYKLGFHFGRKGLENAQQQHRLLQEQLAAANNKSTQLIQDLMGQKGNYRIQMEAQKSLEYHLRSLQQYNAELMQNLALCQKVIGKESNFSGIKIQTFRVLPTQTSQTFRYSVVLNKTGDQDLVEGILQMIIVGNIGKDTIFLPVKYMHSLRSGLVFKFRHFQELTGELTLPNQFEPKEVELKILFNNQEISEHFPWA